MQSGVITHLPFTPGISHLLVFRLDPTVYRQSSEWPQSNTGDHASLPDSQNLSDETVEAHGED